MEIKAYGMQASMDDTSITISANNSFAEGALGAKERTILFSEITFLNFVKGNVLLNHRIIIGDSLGKTVINFVPWRDNYDNAKTFYDALYAIVSKTGTLTDVKPKHFRKDLSEAAG